MKKLLTLLLAALMVFALAACGNSAAPAGSADAQSGELTTLGDALRAGQDAMYAATWNEEHYVYAFDNNGIPTRVVADLTPELNETIDEIQFSDTLEEDEKEQKLLEAIGELPLVSVEDLSSYVLSQEELDSLAGKTGQELIDAGYTGGGSYWSDDDGLTVLLDQGYFSYAVTFEGTAEIAEDQEALDVIPNMIVKGAAYSGFGDSITDLPEAS